MNTYLGIDTSNYRTSAAIFDAGTGQWRNEGRLLDVPQGKIGLRQSEALFQHTVRLHEMVARLPAGAGKSVRAVGVSTRPRAVEGSYMPCFLAGENVARSAAHLLDVPLVVCSHQQGHLAAAALSAGALHLLHTPFLAWHLSGGTTELLLVRPGADGMPDAACIGGTSDLSAGQLVDRAGNLLGLGFPAGAALDDLAQAAENPVKPFAPKVRDGIFSLSGVENKLQELLDRHTPAPELARFTVETIGRAVCTATAQALARYPLPVLCAGGVMANTILREMLSRQFDAHFAAPQLSGDNAVGVAVLAAVRNGEPL
ncbi:DNA-binding protein [Intestinibacillus massiliensis]|uniref:DNA-binding protein n=1 Tax=Intestinibacillus massiliensis TaxID=1871029 RepID=UPI000B36211B|nr:DNA-binding protein [Intestinibacillus massiliensis]